ncbi:hypothetical protein EJB05_31822, partial [Eragrostis curvula]
MHTYLCRSGNTSSKVQENEAGEGSRAITVRLEQDTLECPICFDMFLDSIFQASTREFILTSYTFVLCTNGHGVCERCCDRAHGKCPFCREPIGEIRCLPLNKLIAGMVVPCAFRARGCTRGLTYAGKQIHENLFCQYAPWACPIPGCSYSGVALRNHIWEAHAAAGDAAAVSFVRQGQATVSLDRSTLPRVLLHPPDSKVFLLLNGGEDPKARSLSLLCLGPCPPPPGARVHDDGAWTRRAGCALDVRDWTRTVRPLVVAAAAPPA